MLGAKDSRLARDKMASSFYPSWTSFPVERITGGRSVVVNFSYFCASHSLTTTALDSLVRFIRSLIESPSVDRVLLIHTNSDRDIANENYLQLCRALGRTPILSRTTINYRKRRDVMDAKTVTFVYECAELKEK